MFTKRHREKRSGNVLILTLLAMIGMFGVLALAIDIGYLYMIDSELQRTADAAAMSGAWELYRDKELSGTDVNVAVADAQIKASEYAQLNRVGMESPTLVGEDT